MALRLGSRGDEVKRLQAALGVGADGRFGPATFAAVKAAQEKHGLEVDGIAGPDTLEALGLVEPPPPRLPSAEAAALRVHRARSAVGHKTRYKLGQGGFKPDDDHPWDADGECDCSGFAAWVLGLVRGPLADPPPAWIETTQIVRDAEGRERRFEAVAEPLPGCLAVYPDRPGGGEGHVGVVTEIAPLRGVDCSGSGWRKTGDAIRERGFEFFRNAGALWVVPVGEGNDD